MVLQGNGIGDWLRKGHDYVKKNKLVSRSANALGFHTVGNIAGMLGYNDTKVKRTRRKKK